MYIKHWAASPFDLQHIQTTSEHAVLEFVLVVRLFGHKWKKKKKRKTKPNTPLKNQQNPSTPGVEALVKGWFAHLQFIPKGKQENESSHLFEALTVLSQLCVRKKLDSLCPGSALHFLDFWCPTLPCPDTLLSVHFFYVEQSGPWLTLVLWLLQGSINFSQTRTRTRARSIRSFRWTKWLLLNSSTSVSDLHQLWESPDLHMVSWIFSFLRCLKFQLCTGQYLQSVDVCLPALGNLVVSW